MVTTFRTIYVILFAYLDKYNRYIDEIWHTSVEFNAEHDAIIETSENYIVQEQ